MYRFMLFSCCFVFTSLSCTSDTKTNTIPHPKINEAPVAKESKQETLGAKEKLLSDIQTIEQELSREQEKIDKAKALTFITKSELFAQRYTEDSETASVLFKAAEVAKGIREYGRALKLWDMVYNRYSDYEKAPDALFMQAFVFENDLKDIKLAKMYYGNFLKKYPNHSLADQITIILKNIDKSPEELIKRFEKIDQEAKGKKM